MKRYFLIATLLLIGFSGLAQDKKSMEERAKKMYEHTIKGEFKALMDYTYPRLFEMIPKEKVIEGMQSMLNGNPQFKMVILNTPPNFVYGEIKKVDDGSYALIKHDFKMQMIFNEPITPEEAGMTVGLFKQAMETENVVFDAQTNSITILKQSEVIAAYDKYTNNQWMFTNKTKRELMSKMFSEKVLKELNL